MTPALDKSASPSTRPLVSTGIALFLILLVAAALRLWGIDFGLPQRFHPDEPIVVTAAQYGVVTGDWNPHAFQWPSFQMYILGAEYEVWFLTGKLMGYWQTADPEFISYALHAQGGFYYLGRLTTLVFGVGCVWLMFLLARRFMGIPAALAVAFLTAVEPIMSRHSRYITPDIPAEFFFLAALLQIQGLHSTLRTSIESAHPADVHAALTRAILLTSILIGLGTGTKYPVAFLTVPLLAVILFTPSRLKSGPRLFASVASVVIVAAAFFLTTPFALVEPRRFVTDIATIGQHLQRGHIGMEAPGGIWLATKDRLLRDNGPIWTVAGIAACALFLLTGLRRTWPLLLALVFVLLGLAPLQVFSDRYLVPLVPFLILGTGWLIDRAGAFLERRKCRAWLNATLAIVAVLVMAGGGGVVTALDAYRLTLPDTRQAALEWVVQNIPAGSSIVEEQGGPDLNSIELAPFAPEPTYRIIEIIPLFFRGGPEKDPLDTIVEARPEWVISSSQVRGRYMRPGAEKEFPDIVAAFRIYYSLLDIYLIEEARFSPGNDIVGNEIVIYRVPDGFWDRVRLGETTVDQPVM